MVDTALPPCENTPVLKQRRRTFMVCREHGRVVAWVFTRRNRTRKDGSIAEDIAKICPLCDRLKQKAWRLFKGGRERHRVLNRAWYLKPGNKERKLALQRERRRRARLAAAVLTLVSFFRPGHVSAIQPGPVAVERRGSNGGSAFGRVYPVPLSTVPRTPAISLPRKPKAIAWRFDPCRVSPFFCGLVPGP